MNGKVFKITSHFRTLCLIFVLQTEFGTAIFEDVANVCYDMLDQLQQYKKYLESMKLVRVPLHTPHSGGVAMAVASATDVPSAQSLTTAQGEFEIPARGLSGEVFRKTVFFLQETFFLTSQKLV